MAVWNNKMNLIAFFSNKGTPSTGLSPTIDVWKLDGTQSVTAQAMTEIAGGFYYYDFTTYDEDEDYVIRADGTSTLTGADRYVYSTNETAGVGNILKIEKNRWEIKSNQMIFYDDDGTTALYTFDLKTKSDVPTERDVFKRNPA
ncbi:hypothetical protein LCGC14_1859060 [marine sediment metagenome]|uniref:Uncharacterized protein n=1 Tax=marine sediment metagenome TaxID=412755 RepID=A0A0F9G7W2_9ZZZZ